VLTARLLSRASESPLIRALPGSGRRRPRRSRWCQGRGVSARRRDGCRPLAAEREYCLAADAGARRSFIEAVSALLAEVRGDQTFPLLLVSDSQYVGAAADRQEIRISTSDGRLAACLYRPERTDRDAAPCVILAHGFTGVRDMQLELPAERFAAAGFACIGGRAANWAGSHAPQHRDEARDGAVEAVWKRGHSAALLTWRPRAREAKGSLYLFVRSSTAPPWSCRPAG